MPKITPPLTDEERRRIVEEVKQRLSNRVEYLRTKLEMKLPPVQDDIKKEQL